LPRRPTAAPIAASAINGTSRCASSAIDTLGNFFGGFSNETVASQERAPIAEALAQERLTAAADLTGLQRALNQNPDMNDIRKRVGGLVQRSAVKAADGDAQMVNRRQTGRRPRSRSA
jgi:hypothetical protein